MRWGISNSHLISHNPRDIDGSSAASTRTGYGAGFSVTVPPRAAGAALRGRGAGSAPVRRWATGRHAPGGWAGGPDEQGVRRASAGTGGLLWEAAVPGHEGYSRPQRLRNPQSRKQRFYGHCVRTTCADAERVFETEGRGRNGRRTETLAAGPRTPPRRGPG